MRHFKTGATRDNEDGKLDYEGFLSPLVLKRYAQFMDENRIQKDGRIRASDNWQAGIPSSSYMKSAWRHFISWWTAYRGFQTEEDIEDSVCSLIFNCQGFLHERLKSKFNEKS